MKIFKFSILKKYQLQSVLLMLFILFAVSGCKQKANDRINIILIMADDLGYGDISCFGNETIQTPELDKMAREGMKFTSYYSNGSVCTPTRAALLTGNYQQRSGLEGVIYAALDKRDEGGLSSQEVTLPELLQENGYATGIFGKWHLGYDSSFNPLHHGFDEFYGYMSGNVDYISHRDGIGLYDWWHNLDTVYEEGYVTDLITNHAIKFMEHNQNQPFFLYLPHEAPHYPFQGRDDPAERVPGQDFRLQGSRPDKQNAYKEMIEVMDENIGRIFQKLYELELDDNTLVFFCSDNGAVEAGDNGSLRGHKTSLWEGGIRVPAIAWYPSKIKPESNAEISIISMDLLPTIVSLAGIKTDATFDGIDFSNVMFSNAELPERPLYWRYRGQRAIKLGDWKYLQIGDDEYLFNLKNDISETEDVKEQKVRKHKQLKERLADWENEMDQYEQFTN